MKNILLVGGMGVGKTLIAENLYKKFGYYKVSMSWWLKDVLDNHYDLYNYNKNDIFTINGKEYTKRRLYQYFGTEVMRNFDEYWHIDETINLINKNTYFPFVIDDIRFKNEVIRFKEKFDIITIKIICDDVVRLERLTQRDGSVDLDSFNHISEKNSDIPFDYQVDNSGDIKNTMQQINKIIGE